MHIIQKEMYAYSNAFWGKGCFTLQGEILLMF